MNHVIKYILKESYPQRQYLCKLLRVGNVIFRLSKMNFSEKWHVVPQIGLKYCQSLAARFAHEHIVGTSRFQGLLIFVKQLKIFSQTFLGFFKIYFHFATFWNKVSLITQVPTRLLTLKHVLTWMRQNSFLCKPFRSAVLTSSKNWWNL